MSEQAHTPAAWDQGKCCVPMWIMGSPAGLCGKETHGPQLPALLFYQSRGWRSVERPYCVGPCCPDHGGPKAGDPIVFQDGLTSEGRPMWCAVMPGFINLQESPSGFDGNPLDAVAKLRAAVATAEGRS